MEDGPPDGRHERDAGVPPGGGLAARPKTAAGKAQLISALATGMRASLALLWAGTFLAVLSLYYYMANVWHFFLYPDGGRPGTVGGGVASPARPVADAPAMPAAAVGRARSTRRAATRR